MQKPPPSWQGPVFAGLLIIAVFITATASAAQDTSQPPQITIYSPGVGGGPIYGNHLLVQVQISNFKLDGRLINQAAPIGTGYWKLYIDNVEAGLATSDMIMAPNAAYTRITTGSHHVRVELVDTLGRALVPAAFAETDVNIGQEMIYAPPTTGPPSATIIIPANGDTLDPAKAYVKIRLNNFKLDGQNVNKTNVAGSGHWIATVDGQYAGLSMSEILDLPDELLLGLGTGTHKIEVTLLQNDGTPVAEAVPDSVVVSFSGTQDTSAVPTPTLTGPQLLPPTATRVPTSPANTVGRDALSHCMNGGVYFAEVGHTLCAPFIEFWQSKGGLAIFGFPLTEPFIEAGPTGDPEYSVQYFERARFEYHSDAVDPVQGMQLSLLGLLFHRPDPPVPAAERPNSQYFAATGHNLSGSFRQYWTSNGGLPIFGYPISEQLLEVSPTDGKTYTVQYFERARFEYHPENAGGANEVTLGLLGAQALRARGWIP